MALRRAREVPQVVLEVAVAAVGVAAPAAAGWEVLVAAEPVAAPAAAVPVALEGTWCQWDRRERGKVALTRLLIPFASPLNEQRGHRPRSSPIPKRQSTVKSPGRP